MKIVSAKTGEGAQDSHRPVQFCGVDAFRADLGEEFSITVDQAEEALLKF